MGKMQMQTKDATWYALAGLFIAVAFLPILKASAPQYFRSEDGFEVKLCASGKC
jgi:hypothetical protein